MAGAALPRAAAAALALALASSAARADEGSIELPVGGLVLARSPDVSIEEETLSISPDRVSVAYRVVSRAPAPVTLALKFALPDIDLSDADADYAIPGSDPLNFVDFHASVDGRPVRFDGAQRALLDGRDVTGELKAAGLPAALIGADARARLAGLAPDARARLLEAGLLTQLGADAAGAPIYGPTWTLATVFTRKHVFAPGAAVEVEHRYRTSLGGGPDTPLRKGLRETDAISPMVERYRKDYCLNEDFFRSLDKLAGASPANEARLKERRIAYALTQGAASAGPVKSFRLHVDKGRPDRLVSFCFDNVRKVSPTAFEAQAENFTPTRDLKILLVGRD
ncbi:DUF4424 family protein [Methylocella sp.]|uniref:DUF4424 family protein n=1 Tax=Methylocella sp. TaxID=1978226 RepID=UPI0035B4F9C0